MSPLEPARSWRGMRPLKQAQVTLPLGSEDVRTGIPGQVGVITTIILNASVFPIGSGGEALMFLTVDINDCIIVSTAYAASTVYPVEPTQIIFPSLEIPFYAEDALRCSCTGDASSITGTAYFWITGVAYPDDRAFH